MTKKESSPPMAEGAKVIFRALEENGVEVIFGYPGGAVLPLYDALFQQSKIRHILVRHEQGAAHAAEGYARSTGKVGVILVTSGPGLTNVVTGLADACIDSTPLVCIAGQVATHLIGNDAFQEADTTGITRACTKHGVLVKSPNTLARHIHEAFYVAQNGRPGPVVLDIPKNIQVEHAPYVSKEQAIKEVTYRPSVHPDIHDIEDAIDLIKNAKRPIIYSGGGVINSGQKAVNALQNLVSMTNAPITSTLMGLGAIPPSTQQWLGMLGMHGSYEANMAMHSCDVMLAVGSRFDDRVTGILSEFSPHSQKIHIDIDASSINKNVSVNIGIVADCAKALESLVEKHSQCVTSPPELSSWWGEIERWRKRQSFSYKKNKKDIKPQHAIEALHQVIDRCTNKDVFVTTEVGQHQMWAAQIFPCKKPRRWITSGGLGTMGYGLPAAIGAQVAHPDALVVDIAGEASILMNMQELSTAVQYRLPVKIFILNNRCMGMVRQWQELTYDRRYSETYMNSLPDFVLLAEAYGAKGLLIEKPHELEDGIKDMLTLDGPVIVDCRVNAEENCYPMIPAGAPHYHMIFNEEDPASNDLYVDRSVV